MTLTFNRLFTLITALCLLANHPVTGQTNRDQNVNLAAVPKSLLQPITVNFSNVSLKDAVKEIAEKGDLRLVYGDLKFSSKDKVSVSLENSPALEVLIRVLENTGAHIRISKNGLVTIVPVSEIDRSEIKGQVLDRETGEPLVGANVSVVGTRRGAVTNREGRFVIAGVTDGVYTLEISFIGYKSEQLQDIAVNVDNPLELTIELSESVNFLREVVVTPGRYSIMETGQASKQTLSREDIQTIPQFGEDIYRAMARLPGLAAIDFSAKFTVRGGEHEEVLVLLDGMELYDPFHLKDAPGGGFTSIVDLETVEGIDLMTGAFPAEYGDKMSGVFKIDSKRPEERRISFGVSFINARLMSQGVFNEGKGNWLFSARRGYVDLVLKLIDQQDEISPVYFDIFGKIEYELNQNHILSGHVLVADDKFDFLDTENGETVNTNYNNAYTWLRLKSTFNPKFFAETIVSAGTVNHDIRGKDFDGAPVQWVEFAENKRDFNFFGFKQDWTYAYNEKLLVNGGIDVKDNSVDYNYLKQELNSVVAGSPVYDSRQTKTKANGIEFGTYLSARLRVLDNVIVEPGLRYDYTGWNEEDQVSPRLSTVYYYQPQTSLRLGWGKYYQSHGIHELNVPDGDAEFFPYELSEHFVAGLEHNLGRGITFRLEAYLKKLSNLRPRYESLEEPLATSFGELHDSRTRIAPDEGESKGMEFYIKKETTNKFNWWASYNLASAEHTFDGLVVPKNTDRRHTLYLDLNFRPNPKWFVTVAWQYRSGTPWTDSSVEKIDFGNGSILFQQVFDELNSSRLRAFHRMDIKASRYFDTSRGRLTLFLEVLNLYNHDNVYIISNNTHYNGSTDVLTVTKQEDSFLPLLPSIGFRWDF